MLKMLKTLKMVKNLPAKAGATGNADLIPGSGRFPEEENGNPLQYPCLENSTDRGAWRATAHGVAESRIGLSTHTSGDDSSLCGHVCLSFM